MRVPVCVRTLALWWAHRHIAQQPAGVGAPGLLPGCGNGPDPGRRGGRSPLSGHWWRSEMWLWVAAAPTGRLWG